MAKLGEANIGGRLVPAWLMEGNASAIDFLESTDYPGCIYRKLADGTIEWVNPPLLLDAEYRTMERHNGKPVYVKAINLGALPDSTKKLVVGQTQNAEKIIDYWGTAADQAFFAGALSGSLSRIEVNSTEIVIVTTSDLSMYSAVICVKYTKTTN